MNRKQIAGAVGAIAHDMKSGTEALALRHARRLKPQADLQAAARMQSAIREQSANLEQLAGLLAPVAPVAKVSTQKPKKVSPIKRGSLAIRHQDFDPARGFGAEHISGGHGRLLRALLSDGAFLLRGGQNPPAGDWRTYLLLGGRGSGKTRAGSEWIHKMASGSGSPLRIALVAETHADGREVMIDGVSGILAIAKTRRPLFEASRRRLVWPNGSVAQLFSSEDPDGLRGPQFHLAWGDELAKWKHPQETWDMLQFGLRLGTHPRQMMTTTPRVTPLIKALLTDNDSIVARMKTADNHANLAPGFLAHVMARYGGTRLGRQELDGEMVEDREDALWNRDRLEAGRIRHPGNLGRIVVGVDPPSGHSDQSCCGIVVAGLDAAGRAVVLADCSIERASPAEWGRRVAATCARFGADRIIVEINQGGDMVSAVLRSIEANLPIQTVRASRGKWLRAEPVAALYEQGRVVHCSGLGELEDQMCDFGPDGLSAGRSPDRLDACVWALTALMLSPHGEPRVSGV